MKNRYPALFAAALIIVAIMAFTPLGEAALQALPNNSVGTAQIRAGAVTRGKIRNLNVTVDKVASNAVTAPKIRNLAVTNPKIANGAVNAAKLAPLPGAGVGSAARTTVPPGADVALGFSTVRFNNGGVFSTAAPTRLTAPVTGVYEVSVNVAWGNVIPADNTARRLDIRRNGTAVAQVIRTDTSQNVRVVSSVTTIIRLAAGEFVEVVVSQGSTGPVDVVPLGEISPEFQLQFLSPSA